jgi:hypothetical protein
VTYIVIFMVIYMTSYEIFLVKKDKNIEMFIFHADFECDWLLLLICKIYLY